MAQEATIENFDGSRFLGAMVWTMQNDGTDHGRAGKGICRADQIRQV